MKKVIAFSSVVLGAVLLSGCGYQSADQNIPTASAPASTEKSSAQTSQGSVVIQNFSFGPANLTIKAGTTVTWTNNDAAPHSIKSSSFTSSPNLSTGQTYQLQFNTPGTFSYSCGIHPSMTGTITVQ